MRILSLLLVLITSLTFAQSSISWSNAPAAPITFNPDQSVNMELSYTSPDVDYICIWIRELNAAGTVENEYGAYATCPLGGGNDSHANTDNITYNYTVPANIPETASLPAGNYYTLIILLSDDLGGFANGSKDIVISNSMTSSAQVKTIINAKHSVGGVDSFDRSKFITIHANQTEAEWDGNNNVGDLRNDFLNGYDVYMGRDSGGITWNMNQMAEDPTRPGYVDPTDIASKGQISRNNYAAKTNIHLYESRNNLIVVAQKYPFWTGTGQQTTGQGWNLANGTATGEYMGRYLNEFHGGNDQPAPTYVEIINEPAYGHLGGPNDFLNTLQEVADFHNEVAIAMKMQVPDVKLGGYTAAFPNFEKGDFQRWINRDKLFMDVAGANMDFWSIHLYDFPTIGGKKQLRSGGNVEATFDMMEQYSDMLFNEVKPFVISEYGAQMHDSSKDQWSPYRDWLHLKAQNAQLMSFLSRPNHVLSAINFVIVKAEWGYSNGVPYNHRLMRKENEPTSYTGEWVYTDMVKFYELWQNVNGTRIDITSSDLDVQVDAYAESNKAYVILNNLEFSAKDIDLSLISLHGENINAIQKKHLYLDGNNQPVLLDESIPTNTSSVTLHAESTMILEYTFDNPILIDETKTETKYYATSYLKSIVVNQAETFQINGVTKNTYGEAVLRIGIGRPHGLNLQPTVQVNGTIIPVPSNWRGDDQAQRERFFGVLEIPVPFSLIQTNNTVSVEFPDTGGKISTTTLQVYNFSSDLRDPTLSVDSPKATSSIKVYPNPTSGIINLEGSINYKEVTVYNTTGLKVKSFKTNTQIDISNLANGIYFLKTDTGYHVKVLKK
ncbi:T9SS type A sorting domain-containing protein [Tamlana sp. 2_MG-2023]|uniref:T9SS type A sorting domain-containing protein n=1 Tax=unclassified Tamlana TaxID=2614803 RepID=UPI0026E418DF|nr:MULTISPECIES: T9SS type A sorting domain-containing protein [unclassified Tamlana]MDO6761788.1 T9SS type A sorting domain-containing protein [Tamlana sp. 2_MG-2023]MDO6792549.1 T9SS type A sorting domain-containing protein [Tamlana sp. 1_MG-2023]